MTTALTISLDRTDNGIMALASGRAWKALNKIYSRSTHEKVLMMQKFIETNKRAGDCDGEDVSQVIGERLFFLREHGQLTDWHSLFVHLQWIYSGANADVYRHRQGYDQLDDVAIDRYTADAVDTFDCFHAIEMLSIYNQVVGLLRTHLKHNANVQNHIEVFWRCLIGGEPESDVAKDLHISKQAVNKYVNNIGKCIRTYGREIGESLRA